MQELSDAVNEFAVRRTGSTQFKVKLCIYRRSIQENGHGDHERGDMLILAIYVDDVLLFHNG